MLIFSLFIVLLSNSILFLRDKSTLYSRATISILVIATLTYNNEYFFLNTINTSWVWHFLCHFPWHFLIGVGFLSTQKKRITLTKIVGLALIVAITPILLHIIHCWIISLIESSPFVFLEYNHRIQVILTSAISSVHKTIVKILTKNGFRDFLTNLSILYIIKVVLLGSLSVMDIVSNLFTTNCWFSLTRDFYTITLIKVLLPYLEKFFIGIIKPFLDSYISPTLCDSPKKVAKLFSELPFYGVNRKDMVMECTTSTHFLSRRDLTAQYEEFRLKMSLYTPSSSVSRISGPECSTSQNEPSRGQLDKGKKRALHITQEEASNKRAKLDLGTTKSTVVTREDLIGEDWDLHSIYEKVNNLLEDPNYSKNWTIKKLFDSDELLKSFYEYIKIYQLTTCTEPRHTPLTQLKKHLEEQFNYHINLLSIKRRDFSSNTINFFAVHEKVMQLMRKKDFNMDWTVSKLEFEPWTLRNEFYATLEYLKLTNSRKGSGMPISVLKNIMWEQHSLIFYKPNSITREDFTKEGLNLESIYNKIKKSLEDGDYKEKDPINKLFPSRSPISKDFYAKLDSLNLLNLKNSSKIGTTKIQTLLNTLEKQVDVPIYKDNSITRGDLIGEDWNLHNLYEKITNVIKSKDFNRKSKLSKLDFEPNSLRKDFYTYIKTYNLTNTKVASHTTVLALQERLRKELEITDD